MTPAGQFSTWIEIERATITRDSAGGAVENWASLKGVWAKRQDVSDGEKWRSGQMSATRMARFVIRFDEDLASLDARDRLILDGGIWNVVGVKNIGVRAEHEITAEVRAEGLVS